MNLQPECWHGRRSYDENCCIYIGCFADGCAAFGTTFCRGNSVYVHDAAGHACCVGSNDEDMTMTQNELIIAALKRGPLTSIGIIQAGGTVNPTARLSEIRRLVNIEDEWVTQGNKRYKRYRIVQDDE